MIRALLARPSTITWIPRRHPSRMIWNIHSILAHI